MKDIYTPAETAKMFECTGRLLSRMADRGEITPERDGEGQITGYKRDAIIDCARTLNYQNLITELSEAAS